MGRCLQSSNLERPSQKYYILPNTVFIFPPNHMFPQHPQNILLGGEVEGVKKCGSDHLSICFKLPSKLTNLNTQPTFRNITASSKQCKI